MTAEAVRPPPLGSRLRALLARRDRSLGAGALVTLACNATSTVASGLLAIVLARLLGAEELGRVTLYVAGVFSASLLSDVLGIYFASVYLVARGGHDIPLPVIRGTALAYGLACGLAGGVLVGLTPVRPAIFPGLADPRFGLLLVAGIAANAVLNQARGLLAGQNQFLALGLLNAGQTVLYAVLAVAAAAGLGRRDAWAIAAVHALASALLATAFAAVVVRLGIARPSTALLRAAWRVGVRAAVVNALSFLHVRVDQILVSGILGPHALGLYAVAVTTGELLTRIPSLAGSVLFPLVAAESDRDPAAAAARTLRAAFLAMGVVAAVALPLGLFAGPIVRLLFGDAYAAAVPALRWLLPAIVALAGLYLLNNHLAGMGYPPVKIAAAAASLLINVALNLFLLPRLGIAGASIASAASYGLWLLVLLAWFARLRRRPGPGSASGKLDGAPHPAPGGSE